MPVSPFSMSFDAHSAPLKPYKRTLFLRIVDAIGEANRRKAEREIARFLASQAARTSNSAEHSIGRRSGQR